VGRGVDDVAVASPEKVECGEGVGLAALLSSARPIYSYELWPVHRTPSTSGRPNHGSVVISRMSVGVAGTQTPVLSFLASPTGQVVAIDIGGDAVSKPSTAATTDAQAAAASVGRRARARGVIDTAVIYSAEVNERCGV
jgi:hypothetical protein